MCGICGVVGIESRESGESVVRRMMAAMVHRGPDEEGILLVSPVAVGMRRLSIVDLSGGSQPVWNETGTLAVVYNGEIYNFKSLRAELESAGHKFRTRSDTEVVVHAYEEWGERCAEHLHGMFAFAVVEMPQGRGGRAARVFLARDRMGIKPLYYALVDRKLLFASEVRALLASGCVPACISPSAIPAYLLFGSVCEPLTLIEGVSSLPPGHSMSVRAAVSVSAPAPVRYWDAPRAAPEPAPSPATARSRASGRRCRHASRRRCSRRRVPEQRSRLHGHCRARQPRPRGNPHVHGRVCRRRIQRSRNCPPHRQPPRNRAHRVDALRSGNACPAR